MSHSIDSLEQELGFALLKRGRAGVHLTGEGERMIAAVRNLLNSAEQLNQTAASIRGLDSGTVRIGSFTSVAVHWLPPVLKEFRAGLPPGGYKAAQRRLPRCGTVAAGGQHRHRLCERALRRGL
ncbi:MAG: LysR family transcriptional regulator [Oscillospiraceae bacterium]